jgi:hypothetical protein
MNKKGREKGNTTPVKARPEPAEHFFDTRNRLIIGIGIVDLIIGFYASAWMPKDSFMTMKVGPVLLVIGFLVLLPLGILTGGKKGQVNKPADKKPLRAQ